MKFLIPALAAASLVCPPQTPAVDDATAKARLEKALEATRLVFEPSASGLSFVVTYDHGEERQQTVYVSAVPARPGGLLVHNIYTVVWNGGAGEPGAGETGAGEPSEDLLLHLLTTAKKLGSFYVHQDPKGIWTLRFSLQFDATDLGDESKEGDPLVKRLRDSIAFVDLVGEEADAAINGEQDVR